MFGLNGSRPQATSWLPVTGDEVCPQCDGPHLDNFRFQHRNDCLFGKLEDQRQAADVDVLLTGGAFTRPATAVELELLAVFGVELTPDEIATATVLVNSLSPGYRWRAIAGYAPEGGVAA